MLFAGLIKDCHAHRLCITNSGRQQKGNGTFFLTRFHIQQYSLHENHELLFLSVAMSRQLDYMYGLPTVNSHFGKVSGDYSSLGTRMCVGDENYIWRCPRDESHEDCHGDHGAGVICFMYGQ